jgi:hypothetical protein
MALDELLISVWQQVLVEGIPAATVEGQLVRVERTRSQGLRFLTFAYRDQAIEGIEQNPDKPSRWGQLARAGQRIMQFRCRGRYFANVCEGKVMRYPAWKALQLPD